MNLAPLYKPVFFGLLIIFGLRRVLWPEKVLQAKAAAEAKKKEKKSSEMAPTGAEAPRTAGQIRTVGGIWLMIGLIGLWWNPVHPGFSSFKTAAAEAKDEFAETQRRAAAFARKHSTPNMAVAVVSDGKEHVFGVGRRSLLSLEEVNGDTLFEIGSITKTFTGVLLSKLVLEGKLKLDQPVKTILPPEVPLPEEWGGKITLQHLATHSSGLPMMPPNFPGFFGALKFLAGLDPHPSYSEERFFEGIRKTKLIFQPGEKSDYSNFGTSLLGYALARHLGGEYEQVILREVCQPLGMSATSIRLNSEQKKRRARGYDTVWGIGPVMIGVAAAPWTLPNSFAGAGGLRSSANDMLRYLKANMGAVESPLGKALQKSHEPLMKDSERITIGMNWLRLRAKDGKQDIIWHNGGTGGFRCFIGFTENGRHGVVVLSGSSKTVDPLGFEILAQLDQSGGNEKAVVKR